LSRFFSEHVIWEGVPVSKFLAIADQPPADFKMPGVLVYDDPEHGPTWLEDGPTGWFGMHNQKIKPEDWRKLIIEKLKAYEGDPDTWVWFYDFHI
jgi:hypothetical protein